MTEAVTPPNPADTSDPKRSVPDPTLLTIDALRREIAMLENLTSVRLDAAEALIQERVLRIDALMERSEEMRQEQKSDTRAAVEAALESQKEATAKMEVAVSEQIASLRSNFETAIQGVLSNVADLKDRMTALESSRQGMVEQRAETRQVSSGVVAVVGISITILLAVLTIISFIGMST